jgi:hypothetical protein
MGGKPKPIEDRFKIIVVVKHGVVVDVYSTAYLKYAVVDFDVMNKSELEFETTERYQNYFKDLPELVKHPLN